jgi:hypothetical protein
MNEVVFATISQLPSAGLLLGTDEIEIQRGGNGYKSNVATIGDFVITLIDLEAILNYVKTNLDVLDLQNYSNFTPVDGAILEYSTTNNKFTSTPRTRNQVLNNSTATITWNRLLGHNAEIILTRDIELIMDNFIPGTYQLTITQDNTGGHAFSMRSNTHPIKWANGVAPVVSATANASDTYTFLVPPSNLDIRGVPQFNFTESE